MKKLVKVPVVTWQEYVENLWTWEVGDVFRYQHDCSPSYHEKYRVYFANKEVCFCMSLDRVKYAHFENAPLIFARMTKI